MPDRAKVSAVVISYNRASLIGTVLRGLAFADELIVVDKSSTDATPQIAAGLADRVLTLPWSPMVEESRAFAVRQCAHDWVVCLDDDECLSIAAIRFILAELEAPRARAYALLQKHYILGRHDPRAYYWPEHVVRFFHRDEVTFSNVVHHGTTVSSPGDIFWLPEESGVLIHHLSHESVWQWVEKANRYTSQPDRGRESEDDASLIRHTHTALGLWLSRTRNKSPGGYCEAVALLRALYDIIDRLKVWEERRVIDGVGDFARICSELDAEYAALGVARDRR